MIPKYLLLPFCGATLAVLFYFIVRSGFFSPRAGSAQTSPLGFCALACLVGLFSEQAVLKLKQVAETVFMTVERRKDSNPRVVEVSRMKMRDLGALGFGRRSRERVKLSETLRNPDDVMSQHRFATTRLQ